MEMVPISEIFQVFLQNSVKVQQGFLFGKFYCLLTYSQFHQLFYSVVC